MLNACWRITSRSAHGRSGRSAIIWRRRYVSPDGLEAPIPALVPPPDRDARTEADALRAEIHRFLEADGPLPAHPRLGPMTREEWTRFHCMHCAHHLGFAVPGPE
jgi:hypothetical protein